MRTAGGLWSEVDGGPGVSAAAPVLLGVQPQTVVLHSSAMTPAQAQLQVNLEGLDDRAGIVWDTNTATPVYNRSLGTALMSVSVGPVLCNPVRRIGAKIVECSLDLDAAAWSQDGSTPEAETEHTVTVIVAGQAASTATATVEATDVPGVIQEPSTEPVKMNLKSTVVVIGKPRVTLVTPAQVPTLGLGGSSEAPARVLGQGFGPGGSAVQTVSVGGKACPLVRRVSSTELFVAIPSGVGVGQPVVVQGTGGLKSGDQQDVVTVSYARPAVQGIHPSYALTGVDLMETFEIEGRNFGLRPEDVDAVTVGGQPCGQVEWIGPSRLRCMNVSGTSWDGRDVRVVIAGQASLPNALFEPVGQPEVLAASPTEGREGDTVLLLGAGFGQS